MQPVQVQRLQLAFGIEGQRAVELQRIGIVDAQPAQARRRRPGRWHAAPSCTGMVGQLGVERAEQQLATAQRGVQVDLRRTLGGIQIEAAAAAELLRRPACRWAYRSPAAARVNCPEDCRPSSRRSSASSASTWPPVACPDQTVPSSPCSQPSGQVLQLDLRMGRLVQRQGRARLRLALQRCPPARYWPTRSTRTLTCASLSAPPGAPLELHLAIENPAQVLIALQAAVERAGRADASPSPAHRPAPRASCTCSPPDAVVGSIGR